MFVEFATCLWDCPINISNSAGSYNPEKSHQLHCGMNYHLEIMLAETFYYYYYYYYTELSNISNSLVHLLYATLIVF